MLEAIITEDKLLQAQSSNGGWSKKQLELLNVEWPPQKGWKRRIIGTPIKKETMEKVIALKDDHL